MSLEFSDGQRIQSRISLIFFKFEHVYSYNSNLNLSKTIHWGLSIIRIDQTSTMYAAFGWLGSFVRIINMNVNTKLSLRVYIFQIYYVKKKKNICPTGVKTTQ